MLPNNLALLLLRLALSAPLAACGQAAPPAALPRPPAGRPAVPAPVLTGHWQSLTDARSGLDITATAYTERYAGQVVAASAYVLGTRCGCPDARPLTYKTPVVLTVRNAAEADCSCYLVRRLTATTLELANYGQGGTLRFRRVP